MGTKKVKRYRIKGKSLKRRKKRYLTKKKKKKCYATYAPSGKGYILYKKEADAVEFSKSGCLWADHKMNIISKDLHDDTCLLHCKCHRGKAKARKRKKR
jgi:hypothetical protein